MAEPVKHMLDNRQLYEQAGLWESQKYQDAHYLRKVAVINGIIPADVSSILDVGCGNGAILENLSPQYWTVGGDRSWSAIKKSQQRLVQMSADSLPFKAHAFSMVMCHQIFEHLPDDILFSSAREMSRVAEQYVMVSVPYQERIEQERARCGNCSTIYNIWGHVRSFQSVNDVRNLFPDFDLRFHVHCGRENVYRSALALWCMQDLGGYWTTNAHAVCPGCGWAAQYVAGYPRRALATLAARIDQMIKKQSVFYWLICLFERKVRG